MSWVVRSRGVDQNLPMYCLLQVRCWDSARQNPVWNTSLETVTVTWIVWNRSSFTCWHNKPVIYRYLYFMSFMLHASSTFPWHSAPVCQCDAPSLTQQRCVIIWWRLLWLGLSFKSMYSAHVTRKKKLCGRCQATESYKIWYISGWSRSRETRVPPGEFQVNVRHQLFDRRHEQLPEASGERQTASGGKVGR